jgi:hypothetical protein
MVASLFTNPNWDSKDNDRTGRIKELNYHFNRAIELVYDPDLEYEDEPDWSNPFWQGHVRSIARTREKWGLTGDESMREVIESDAEEMGDLLELEVRASSSERARMRRGVDQLA